MFETKREKGKMCGRERDRERPERERLLKAREMMVNYVGSNEREREREREIESERETMLSRERE